jgi:hypothetical protein
LGSLQTRLSNALLLAIVRDCEPYRKLIARSLDDKESLAACSAAPNGSRARTLAYISALESLQTQLSSAVSITIVRAREPFQFDKARRVLDKQWEVRQMTCGFLGFPSADDCGRKLVQKLGIPAFERTAVLNRACSTTP